MIIILVCTGESGTDVPGNQVDDNQSQATSFRPDELVRKSDLNSLKSDFNEFYLKMELKFDETFSFIDKYDKLQTKYINLVERLSGDQSAIGEREREYEELLKKKEDLKRELEKSNMNKDEIEKKLEDEKAKHKELQDEHDSLEREMEKLKTEMRRLDEEMEREKSATKLQPKQYDKIQRAKKRIEFSEKLYKKLADRNLQIASLKRDVQVLNTLLRQR